MQFFSSRNLSASDCVNNVGKIGPIDSFECVQRNGVFNIDYSVAMRIMNFVEAHCVFVSSLGLLASDFSRDEREKRTI